MNSPSATPPRASVCRARQERHLLRRRRRIPGSTCFQGVCKGGTQQCECKPDDLSNCYKKAIFDKDNKCAATPGCSKAGSEFFKCVDDPEGRM